MKSPRILVINPNSNSVVTDGLRAALADIEAISELEIECRTLADAPFGIETDEDIRAVEPLVVATILANPQFSAYVIACYSDPGLSSARRQTPKPVFGIQQSALATARALGRSAGVLALGADSIRRHLDYVRQLGWESSLAGERSLNLSVDQAAQPSAMDRILTEGRILIDEAGAEILILGCAGMARHREEAEMRLKVPVIDPTQVAVGTAADLSMEVAREGSRPFLRIFSPTRGRPGRVFRQPPN